MSNPTLRALFSYAETGEVAEKDLQEFRKIPRAELNAPQPPHSFSLLHLAALNSKEAPLKFLLDLKANVTARDKLGRTPLHAASYSGFIPGIALLLQAVDNLGFTAIFLAANGETTTALVKHEADVNHQDSGGRSAAYWACYFGRISDLNSVEKHDADLNARDKFGQTLWHACAASSGGGKCAKFLKNNSAVEFDLVDSDGRTPLHLAARAGLADFLKEWIPIFKPNLSTSDRFGRTSLHEAAFSNSNECLSILLEQCETLYKKYDDLRRQYEKTPRHQKPMLQRALEKARQESATWLLDKADEQGFTALHYAIMKDADSCVEVLLHHDRQGRTPILTAALHGAKKCLRYLLVSPRKPNVLAVDAKKRNALHLLALSTADDEALAAELLDRDLAENPDEAGFYPLTFAIERKRKNMLEAFLAKPAVFERKDARGRTALMAAAVCGDRDIYEKVKKASVTVLNSVDELGNSQQTYAGFGALEATLPERSTLPNQASPLHVAASRNSQQLPLLLLHPGEDANRTDAKGRTPLHYACYYSPAGVVTLIQAKAKPFIRDNFERTPIDVAAFFNKPKAIAAVLQAIPTRPIQGLDFRSSFGFAPLHLAALSDAEEVTKFLLRAGARATVVNLDGQTPLHFAAASSSRSLEPLLWALQRLGRNPELPDRQGRTPLHAAAAAGNTESLSLLLSFPVNVNASDRTGATPLHVLASASSLLPSSALEAARLLLERGADVNGKNKKGQSPLDAPNILPQLAEFLRNPVFSPPAPATPKTAPPLASPPSSPTSPSPAPSPAVDLPERPSPQPPVTQLPQPGAKPQSPPQTSPTRAADRTISIRSPRTAPTHPVDLDLVLAGTFSHVTEYMDTQLRLTDACFTLAGQLGLAHHQRLKAAELVHRVAWIREALAVAPPEPPASPKDDGMVTTLVILSAALLISIMRLLI